MFFLKPPQENLGGVLARLRRLGAVLGRLGGDSGPAWAFLKRLGGVLEPLGRRLGAAWGASTIFDSSCS